MTTDPGSELLWIPLTRHELAVTLEALRDAAISGGIPRELRTEADRIERDLRRHFDD